MSTEAIDQPMDTYQKPCSELSDAYSRIHRINLSNNKFLDIHLAHAINALAYWNCRNKLFQIGNKIVEVGKDGSTYKIIDIHHKYLKCILAETAYWYKETKEMDDDGNPKKVPAYPNDAIVGGVLEASQRWKNVPYLKGLTNTPIPRPDGSIHIKHGYDKVTGYYFTPGLHIHELPDDITKEWAEGAAASLTHELFSNFPLKDDASKANLLAALITAILRPICGISPLFVISKPSPGEGASLLVELISLVCTGNTAPVRDANSKDDEEWRKLLISLLRAGTIMVNLDNLHQNSKFETPVMASFLTSTKFSDRILGQSATIELYNTMVCFLTGRNVKLAGDIPRRTVLIELKEMDRYDIQHPEERKFLHQDIKRWVTEHRAELVETIFVMLKAWVVAGKPIPPNLPTIGSFETWATTIGGILDFAGVKGFLGNRQYIYEEMDTENDEWKCFAKAWNLFPALKDFVSARTLLEAIEKSKILQDAIPSELEKPVKDKNTKAIGNILQSQKNVLFGDGLVIKTQRNSVSKSYEYKADKISA
jgi:hypothetical protein